MRPRLRAGTAGVAAMPLRPVASGVPCAMPVMVYDSITSTPSRAPDLARIAVDHVLDRRRRRSRARRVHCARALGIHRLDGRVGAAVPDRTTAATVRDAATLRARDRPIARAERGFRPWNMLSNASCTLVAAAVRQAGDDRAAGEHLRIRRQHRRRHRAAGGQTGDEDALDDRCRAPRSVARSSAGSRAPRRGRAAVSAGRNQLKQVLRIVGALLLREQQREAVPVGKRRPARAKVVAGGRLRAAVQHDDERPALWQASSARRSSMRRLPGLLPKAATSRSRVGGAAAAACGLARPSANRKRAGSAKGRRSCVQVLPWWTPVGFFRLVQTGQTENGCCAAQVFCSHMQHKVIRGIAARSGAFAAGGARG